MMLRNGIKTTLRERGRTALFFCLILFLTLALVLALGVLFYCTEAIRVCNEQYHSIALVEYMGGDYPDGDVADAAARAADVALDEDAILAVDGVKSWRRGAIRLGYTADFNRRGGTLPHARESIIVVTGVGTPSYYDYNGEMREYYRVSTDSVLYSREGEAGLAINLMAGESGFVPEKGKQYVVNGVLYNAPQLGQPTNGLKVFVITAFESSDEAPYAEWTPDGETPAAFTEAAELYRVRNNYIRILPCADVNDVSEFQQSELMIDQGEFPDPNETGACVISRDMSEQMGLHMGDRFTAEDLVCAADDLYDVHPTGQTREYTVRGVVNASYVYYGCVWVIDASADTPLFGYQLGTAALDNATGEQATESLRALMPEGVRVTLLDQGYSETVKPFAQVRSTAFNVLLVCAAGVLAVLFLFAFLYVGRQSYSVRIMVCLGTPRRRVAVWMLAGALLITLTAAAVGVGVGVLTQPVLLAQVADYADAERASSSFYLYSETQLSVLRGDRIRVPALPLWPSLAAGGAVVGASVLLCAFFLGLAYRGGTRKKGKSRLRVPKGKTSTFGFGPWRFARLSIRRGGLRTLVVPLVCLILTVIIIFLGGVYQGWLSELETAKRTTPIEGMVTSLNGRFYSRLAIPISNIRALHKVENIGELELSTGEWKYWRDEDVPEFSDSGYGLEHFQDWIGRQASVTAVSSLRAAKEFYYLEPQLTWLTGWDESMLRSEDVPLLYLQRYHELEAEAQAARQTDGAEEADEQTVEAEPVPAVFGDKFLKSHGLKLGDTFACNLQVEFYDWPVITPVRLLVVGAYQQGQMKPQIYVPLASCVPPELLDGEDGDYARVRAPVEERILESNGLEIIRSEIVITEERLRDYLGTMTTFSTCRFRLPSAEKLDALREALNEAEFSAVGVTRMIRSAIVLGDAAYIKFAESMERNIAIGQAMGIAISALVILLGFLISWLMTNARKREFALMRGFGAPKLRVFLSFFHEQFLLCLLGYLLGCVSLRWLYSGGRMQLFCAAGFFVCYLLGCVVAIRINSKTKLMELLTVHD